jgi:hypothetical protein
MIIKANNTRYIFIHIPKTAGTSILKYFKNTENGQIHEKISHNSYANSVGKLKSFAMVRNPYDRLLSIFLHWRDNLKRIKETTEFEEFVLNLNKPKLWCKPQFVYKWYSRYIDTQVSWISNRKNVPIVDYIIKFENINEDFNNFLVSEEFEDIKELPHTNKTSHTNYKDYYNDDMIKIVENKYKWDLEYFNYSF